MSAKVAAKITAMELHSEWTAVIQCVIETCAVNAA